MLRQKLATLERKMRDKDITLRCALLSFVGFVFSMSLTELSSSLLAPYLRYSRFSNATRKTSNNFFSLASSYSCFVTCSHSRFI